MDDQRLSMITVNHETFQTHYLKQFFDESAWMLFSATAAGILFILRKDLWSSSLPMMTSSPSRVVSYQVWSISCASASVVPDIKVTDIWIRSIKCMPRLDDLRSPNFDSVTVRKLTEHTRVKGKLVSVKLCACWRFNDRIMWCQEVAAKVNTIRVLPHAAAA